MKKSDAGLKIFTATLFVLVITGMVNRFIYSAFVMSKEGVVYWYNWELWKQYFAWLPGKILCIALAVQIAALLIEAIYFIFRSKNNESHR